MKNLYNIIIIIFVALSLYIIRDDVLNIYNKGSNLVKNFISLSKNIYEDKIKDFNKIDFIKEKDISIYNEYTNGSTLPGPLSVSSQLLSDERTKINFKKENVIEETNLKRKDNNLEPLKMSDKLNLSAEKKVMDMFEENYFEHISPSGVSVSDLGEIVSYDFILIGENLAMGNFKSEKALVDAWMDSPGHRSNILNNKYTEIGVAVSYGVYDGKNVLIAVQHFATPKDICPKIDESLYGIININQKEIKDIEQELLDSKEIIDKRVVFEGKTRNEQITQYNELVNIYNKLILELKNKISVYNKQVSLFNSCIESIAGDSDK